MLNVAFKTFGDGNAVIAGPGPVAIAGSILQNGQATTKIGPGININGFKIGGAAAVASRKRATASAATAQAGSRTSIAPAAVVRNDAKKPTASAVAAGRGSQDKR